VLPEAAHGILPRGGVGTFAYRDQLYQTLCQQPGRQAPRPTSRSFYEVPRTGCSTRLYATLAADPDRHVHRRSSYDLRRCSTRGFRSRPRGRRSTAGPRADPGLRGRWHSSSPAAALAGRHHSSPDASRRRVASRRARGVGQFARWNRIGRTWGEHGCVRVVAQLVGFEAEAFPGGSVSGRGPARPNRAFLAGGAVVRGRGGF